MGEYGLGGEANKLTMLRAEEITMEKLEQLARKVYAIPAVTLPMSSASDLQPCSTYKRETSHALSVRGGGTRHRISSV